MDFSEPLYAAVIGATATVLTALIQLRISWRRELRERERGQPISKKARRGPVIAVMVLMSAAAVGGFVLSQYFISLREGDRDALRADLQAKLTEISASAARLEQARMNEREQIETGARRTEALHRGEEGVAANVVIGACKPESAPPSGTLPPGTKPSGIKPSETKSSETKPACSEQNAMRVAVCARVPAPATVTEVLLFTRFVDSQQSWPDSRVQAGQDAGQARFVEKVFELPDIEATKQVCHGFVHWNSDKSRFARILVKYTLQP